MRNVDIKQVDIKGFGSILDLTYNLYRPGLNIIVGENGVGKTTLFNAIFWCLFGRTTKNVVNSDIPTLKEYRGKGFKGTYVSIDMEIDGHPYKVVRTYRNKHSFPYLVDPSGLTMIDKVKEIDLLNEVKLADSQRILESKLGIDATTFQNSVFFGQNTDRLMDSPDGDKRKIFEDILAHIVSDLDTIKNKVQEDRREQTNENNKVINKINREEGRLTALQDQYEHLGKDEEHAREILNAKLAEINKRIDSEVDMGRRAKKSNEEANKEYARVVEVEAKIRKRIKMVESKYNFREIEERYINYSSEHQSLQRSIQQTRDTVTKITTINEGDTCTVCGSIVTSDTIERVTKEAEESAKEAERQVQEMRKEMYQVKQNMEAAKKQLDIRNTLETLKEKHRLAKDQLESIRNTVETNNYTLKTVKERIQYLNERYAELEDEYEETIKKIEHIKDEIDKQEAIVTELKVESKKYEDKIKYLDWWSRVGLGSGGVTTYLYESILVAFNKALTRYSEVLGMAVRLTIDKTKKSRPFLLECYDKGVYKNYKSLSGGEQQRVNIGILFALYEVISSKTVTMNILLLDEVFEGLDEVGTSMVFEIIKMYQDKSIYVITHNKDKVTDGVEFIQVTKDDNGTIYD